MYSVITLTSWISPPFVNNDDLNIPCISTHNNFYSTESDDVTINSESSPLQSMSLESSDVLSHTHESSDSAPFDEYVYDTSDEMSIKTPSISVPSKNITLSPSCFLNGCSCGHGVIFRDMIYESRKNRCYKSRGVTIRPKIPAINVALRLT